MNGATLCEIFESMPFLKNFFRGIFKFENIVQTKTDTRTWNARDFAIINLQNAHWFTLLWINSDTVILFDTLSGNLTLKKPIMKQTIVDSFIGVEHLIFQYGKNKIQKNGALTCGEHVVYYVLYQNLFYLENGRFDLDYISKIVKYCNESRLNTDEFVWIEIYSKLKLAEPPDLMAVLMWYENYLK